VGFKERNNNKRHRHKQVLASNYGIVSPTCTFLH